MIQKALASDILKIAALARKTRKHMVEMGLNQWVGDYPNEAHFLADLNNDGLYIYKKDDEILASISLLNENDEAYKKLVWHKDNALVIHRVIVDPTIQRLGIGKQLFIYAIELGKELGYDSIKVDTHPDNIKMKGLIQKMGFVYIGYLSKINRLAYELVLQYTIKEVILCLQMK